MPLLAPRPRRPGRPRTWRAAALLAVALLLVAAPARACGRLTLAQMNWASADLLAQVDRLILQAGYGCQVDLVPGDTVPTLTAMVAKGQPDVAPEAWINGVREPVEKAVAAGRLHLAGTALADGGVEGWWIPKHVADAHPQIRSIGDALQRPDLFPAPENAKQGAIHGCPAGWQCQIVIANLFKALGAAQRGFVLVDPGSAAALDGTVARAHQRKQGWLGYYWSPTPLLGQYPMVKLADGVAHDAAEWQRCTSVAGCADPRPNTWPRAQVFTLVTDRFRQAGGPAYAYLARRSWPSAVLNAQLAWMRSRQATGEQAARQFLKTRPEVWQAWVDPAVAAKLRAAL